MKEHPPKQMCEIVSEVLLCALHPSPPFIECCEERAQLCKDTDEANYGGGGEGKQDKEH